MCKKILSIILISLFSSCVSDEPMIADIPVSNSISEITSNSVIVKTVFGENTYTIIDVTDYGHAIVEGKELYVISEYHPTSWSNGIAYSHMNNTIFQKEFETKIENLKPNTEYTVNSYFEPCCSQPVTLSSQPITFTTSLILAEVSTGLASSVNSNSAIVGGSITSMSTSIVQYGHIWSTQQENLTFANPYTRKSKLGETNIILNYESELTNLSPNTTYYVVAYAIDKSMQANEASYGEVIMFKTTVK